MDFNAELPLIRTKEEFIKEYIEPAATGLANRVKNGEPLTELDRKVLIACEFDPDELTAFYRALRS